MNIDLNIYRAADMHFAEPVQSPTPTLRSARLFSALASVRGWALVIFGISVMLRVCYAVVAARLDPMLARDPLLGDAASYDRIARTLLQGGGYGESIGNPSAFWPPIYPFFLTGVYGILGYNFTTARILQAVLGATLPPLVFLIATLLHEQRAGRWTSIGAALYPYLIYFGAWLISESLYFALLGLLLWYGIRFQQAPTYKRAILFGVIVGIATLTKPTTLFQLPFMILWFLCCIVGRNLRQRALLGFITAITIALVLAPWAFRNYTLFGTLILGSTNGGYTFYGANNPDAFGGHYERFPPPIAGLNEAEEQTEYYRRGMQWIRENPKQFAWLVGQKFKRLVSPLSVASSKEDFSVPGATPIRVIYSAFLVLAFLGLCLTLRRWREFYLLYTPVFGVILSTILFYGDVRYTLPAVPTLVLFAALAATAVLDRIKNQFQKA